MDFGIEELLSVPTNVAASIVCFTNACVTNACVIEVFVMGPVLSLLMTQVNHCPRINSFGFDSSLFLSSIEFKGL